MKIEQLMSFHQVAATGSFTRAARKLFLTQPAISQQVRTLEHTLGAILFDRTGKKAVLTGPEKRTGYFPTDLKLKFLVR